MSLNLTPPRLAGQHVRLEPLCEAHLSGLCEAGREPAIWTWFPKPAQDETAMHQFVRHALDEQQAGRALPFAQIDARSGVVVGSTRFTQIETAHRRAEIGWTWLAPCAQRTAINTEAKYLLLRHAFETMGLMRVEFKADRLNEPSRRALTRIGAVEEGVFRRHMITATGRVRDSVWFSIVDTQWPDTRLRLEQLLARSTSRAA